ncbi:MAG TPA: ATP-binding protein [Phycisphaerales bacterium]|nr:ATP-binding protein [Phycisphaerales bacterium]
MSTKGQTNTSGDCCGGRKAAANGTTDACAPLCIRMLSQARYLSGARELVSAVAKRFGFAEEISGKIALAVDEALCNVIRHGYDRRPDGPIWLSIWPEGVNGSADAAGDKPTGIRIVIEDEAQQVDPDKIKGRELEDVRPGGLGVFIMRQVMNSVKFEKRPDKGMRLEMVKSIEESCPCSPKTPNPSALSTPPSTPST